MATNLGDFNELWGTLQETMDLVTGVEGATINEFLQSIVDRMDKLDKYISIFRRHIPFIYTQKDITKNDGIFVIDMPADHIIQDSVIYFLPTESSVDPSEAQNKLQIFQKGELISEYLLVKETQAGTLQEIGAGMIVPNRTCMLRLIHSQTNLKKAVLINATYEMESTFSLLSVMGGANFKHRPLVGDGENASPLVTLADLNEVIAELTQLKDKFMHGTQNPLDALADKPEGTMYFKVEDYNEDPEQ